MSQCPEATLLSDAEYRQLTNRLLAAIEATTDRWLQDDVIDIATIIEFALSLGPIAINRAFANWVSFNR